MTLPMLHSAKGLPGKDRQRGDQEQIDGTAEGPADKQQNQPARQQYGRDENPEGGCAHWSAA